MERTELETFILALDTEIKDGVRAEVALRRLVTKAAESIRQRESTLEPEHHEEPLPEV